MSKVAQPLSDALRKHVFNKMPIRVLKLPEMELFERGAVLQHLLRKLSYITPRRWKEMTEDCILWHLMRPSVSPHNLKPDIKTELDNLQENLSGPSRVHSWPSSFPNLSTGFAHFSREVIESATAFLIDKIIKNNTGYAILSHTWLEIESEVTYEDRTRSKRWKSIQSEGGAGYRKLFSFCKTAYNVAKVDFAWMDTVCINKDSRSELEESIRSMYRWYKLSDICIAYLGDTDLYLDMEHDRWFTRGWTLQELLAPQKIKFFNKKWNPLTSNEDDKTAGEINSIIERAAGIDHRSLTLFTPGIGRGVAYKMAWAARRQTTRAEDIAYCLMGIFGVSFSIAYGEGAERAFLRLIEAIMTTYPNCFDIFNFAGPPIKSSIHWSNILPSCPECYLRHNPDLILFDLLPRHPLSLTHIGLRIQVLIVSARPDPQYKFFTFTAKQKLECVGIQGWTADPVYCHIDLPLIEDPFAHFGFAIWNFDELPGGTIRIPSLCAIFLLDLNAIGMHSKEWSEDVALDSINPGSKIDTEEVLTLRKTGMVGSVAKSDLPLYGIKYVSAYL